MAKLKMKSAVCVEFDESTGISKEHLFTHGMAIKGMKLMADTQPRHFAAMLAETDDSETADVFIQLCIFKTVRYG